MDQTQLKYTKTHEWICVEGDVATMGITNFATDALTDLVFLGLPEVGTTIEPGETIGEIESVKAVSDLYAPFAGEVVDANMDLADDLDTLSASPFEQGWLLKIKMADANAADSLMDRSAYEAYCAAESE
jgi:glycine cleavage system H protein